MPCCKLLGVIRQSLYSTYVYRMLDRDIRRIDPAACSAVPEAACPTDSLGAEDTEDDSSDDEDEGSGDDHSEDRADGDEDEDEDEDDDEDEHRSAAGLAELHTALGAHPLLQQQQQGPPGSVPAAVDCKALGRFIGALQARGPNARLRDTLSRVKVGGPCYAGFSSYIRGPFSLHPCNIRIAMGTAWFGPILCVTPTFTLSSQGHLLLLTLHLLPPQRVLSAASDEQKMKELTETDGAGMCLALFASEQQQLLRQRRSGDRSSAMGEAGGEDELEALSEGQQELQQQQQEAKAEEEKEKEEALFAVFPRSSAPSPDGPEALPLMPPITRLRDISCGEHFMSFGVRGKITVRGSSRVIPCGEPPRQRLGSYSRHPWAGIPRDTI